MRWLASRRFRTGIAIIIFVLISGCLQAVPVSKYDLMADSTQKVLAGTAETYIRIEKFQRRFIIETLPDAPLTPESFLPSIDGQSFDLAPELQFREAALETLVRYMQALRALAKWDSEEDMEKCADDLAGSLKNLSNRMPNPENSTQAAGMLAAAVEEIGEGVVRWKRIDALKSIMDASQKDIEKLSQLIVGSNEKIKRTMPIMLTQILAHNNRERPARDTADRVKFDGDVAAMVDEVTAIQAALDSYDKAMANVPIAHSEIRDLLAKKPTAQEGLRQLLAEGQHVNKFYRSLK